MTPLVRRISRFLQSPQGRTLVERGQRELAKPSTREKLRRIVARVSGRR